MLAASAPAAAAAPPAGPGAEATTVAAAAAVPAAPAGRKRRSELLSKFRLKRAWCRDVPIGQSGPAMPNTDNITCQSVAVAVMSCTRSDTGTFALAHDVRRCRGQGYRCEGQGHSCGGHARDDRAPSGVRRGAEMARRLGQRGKRRSRACPFVLGWGTPRRMRCHPAQQPWPRHSLKQATQNMCTLSTAWHCVSLSELGDTSVSVAAMLVSAPSRIGDRRRPESRAGQGQFLRVRVLRAQVGGAGGMAHLGGRRRADELQAH